MTRHRLFLVAAVIMAIGVTVLIAVAPRAKSSAHVTMTVPSAGPTVTGLPSATAGPTATSPTPSPSASKPPHTVKPTPKPTGTGTKPKPPATPHPPAQPNPMTITAASLAVPGAGTLKIPSWPDQPGMRYRGPDGSMGSTGTSSVALTFDDGPSPYTSQILDVLDEFHVKATFCIIGRQVAAYHDVIARMINDGMTICDHSWDHDEQIATKPVAYQAANLQKMINAIHAVNHAATVAYYRNPAGNFNTTSCRVSELLGMRPLYWTEDTDDWTRPGVPAIEHSLLTTTHRDSIVLMHDGGGDRSETIAALKAMLPTLKAHYHLIALSTSRTDSVPPGAPAAPPSAPPSTPASTPPSTPAGAKP